MVCRGLLQRLMVDRTTAVYHFVMPKGKRAIPNAVLLERVTKRIHKVMENRMAPRIDGDPPEIKVIGAGKVADSLIAEAGDGLLVVGSRGITRLAWVLLGSAANRVAARARGPVLVVREKGAQPRGVLERLTTV